MPPLSRNTLVLLALVLAIVFLAYFNHFHNGFHLDDAHTIQNNPHIRSLANIPKFFTDTATFSTLPANQTYRPVVSASLAIDYALAGGLDPFWFHLSTFFWYLVQLALMFLLFRTILDRTTADPRNDLVALFATAVYGLHPACAETVNYVIQRGDLYATLGVIAGIGIYAWSPGTRKFGLYLLPVAAAQLAKPPALVFPALLFAFDFLFIEKPARRNVVPSLLRSTPSILLTIALAVLQAKMTPGGYKATLLSAHDYCITQPYVALRYVLSFFLPIHLTADSDLATLHSIFEPLALAGFLFIAAVLIAAWIASAKPAWRPAGFGLWWFVIALLPTSLYPLSELENDHRMFFPFVGLALSASWTVALALYRKTANQQLSPIVQRVLFPALVTLLVLLSLGARTRNEVWHSEESLWFDAATKSPNSSRAFIGYGLTLLPKHDYRGALAFFEKALTITPNYYIVEINLGGAYAGLHRDAEAESHFQRAIQLAPLEAQPRYAYARWLMEQGRTGQSLAHDIVAMTMNRSLFEARYLAMQIYSDAGDWQKVQKLAEETLQISPADAAARKYLAQAKFGAGPPGPPPQVMSADDYLLASNGLYRASKFQESIEAAREALRENPNLVMAYNNLAACYQAMGQVDRAIQAVEEALRIKPDFEMARDNLAQLKAYQEKERTAKR